MGANHRRALWMLLQASFLPSYHQLQDISLETGDLQASLGTHHPFKKSLWALCQRAQGCIDFPWLMGTQQAILASASPHRSSAISYAVPVGLPGGIDSGAELSVRTEHLASLQPSFKLQSHPGCRQGAPP